MPTFPTRTGGFAAPPYLALRTKGAKGLKQVITPKSQVAPGEVKQPKIAGQPALEQVASVTPPLGAGSRGPSGATPPVAPSAAPPAQPASTGGTLSRLSSAVAPIKTLGESLRTRGTTESESDQRLRRALHERGFNTAGYTIEQIRSGQYDRDQFTRQATSSIGGGALTRPFLGSARQTLEQLEPRLQLYEQAAGYQGDPAQDPQYQFYRGELERQRTASRADVEANAARRGVFYGTPLTTSYGDIESEFGRGLGQLSASLSEQQLQRLALAIPLLQQLDTGRGGGLDIEVLAQLGRLFGSGGRSSRQPGRETNTTNLG